MNASANDSQRIVLPAVALPGSFVETPFGRLQVPGWSLQEKDLVVQPSLIAELTRLARDAATRAHAPYSKFHVGAALVMADDPEQKPFTGGNVENASYGATLCAERNAITTAAGAGFRRIGVLVVSTADSLGGPLETRSPCGPCRQVIGEFADDSTVIVIDQGNPEVLGDIVDRERLLPWGFRFSG